MAIEQLILKDVRLAFAEGLTEKTKAKGFDTAVAKHNAKFIIPKNHSQVKEVNDLLVKLANEAWGSDKTPNKGTNALKSIYGSKDLCFRDGDLVDWDGFNGCFFIHATNQNDFGDRKGIQFRDSQRNPIADIAEVKKKLYSGCYVNVILSLYTPKDRVQIPAFVTVVQFWRDGEPLTAGINDSALPVAEGVEVCTEDAPAAGIFFS